MPKVKKLNLRSNTCRNQGVEALADFLKTNTTVTEVNLNENNLGDPGAIAMAGAIAENKTLTSLDLSLNYIGDEGAQVPVPSHRSVSGLLRLEVTVLHLLPQALGEALGKNKTLTTLLVSGNEIKDYDLRQKVKSRNPKAK